MSLTASWNLTSGSGTQGLSPSLALLLRRSFPGPRGTDRNPGSSSDFEIPPHEPEARSMNERIPMFMYARSIELILHECEDLFRRLPIPMTSNFSAPACLIELVALILPSSYFDRDCDCQKKATSTVI